MSALLRRLAYFLRRSRHDADLRDEIESHRAHRQDALQSEGLEPAAAAWASRQAMGNVTLAVEDTRDVWAVRALDNLQQDVRAAVRGLRKSPGFAVVAIGTLALGIGANTALFSIFSSLILRPLPVRDPGSLALLTNGSWSYPIWKEIQARETELFEAACAWSGQSFDLSPGGQSDLVDGAYVSGGFFDVLGVTAIRGRMITPADDGSAAPDGSVAVISHRLWRQRFAGANDVVGRRLTVQRIPFTIVGVMPPGFFGPDVGLMTDVMLPFAAEPLIRGQESWLARAGSTWLQIMVRLKPGQSLEQANAVLRTVQPQIVETSSMSRQRNEPLTLVSAATGNSSLRTRFETPLFAMVVAVGLVLLVACANIASLLLARVLARRRELSVRLALGSSRWRIVRLLFIESLIVAVAGAGLGLMFAKWSSALLVQQLSTWERTVSLDLALDWRVLAFTAAVACLSAIVAGVAPVLGLKSVGPGEALKDAGRGIAGDRRLSVRRYARCHPDCCVTRPGRRGGTVPADICLAQPVAAWLRARATARRGIEPPGERRAARSARSARRAPARRGGRGPRRAFGIRVRGTPPHRGRLVNRHRRHRRWASGSPEGRWPATVVAECHDTRLVRDDGHASA